MAGLCGLVLAGLMVAGFALDIGIMATTGGAPVISTERVGEDLVRVQESPIWALEGWVYTLMLVPASFLAPGLYWMFRSRQGGELPAIGLIATLMFWALHTAHNVAILTVVSGLAPSYVPGSPGAASVEAVARGFIASSEVLFVPGGGLGTLFWVIAGLIFGKLILNDGKIPRWLGYVSIGGAALAALGYLQYAVPPLFVLGLIGWILLILWTAGISLYLVRAAPASGSDTSTAGRKRVAEVGAVAVTPVQ